MRGVNRVFILGRLGRKPELKKTANQHSYVDLSVATNRPIRQDDLWSEQTQWHQIRTWEKNAELCVQILNKGAPIAIEGHLRTDSWNNAEGERRSKTYVQADRIHFLPHNKTMELEEVTISVADDQK